MCYINQHSTRSSIFFVYTQMHNLVVTRRISLCDIDTRSNWSLHPFLDKNNIAPELLESLNNTGMLHPVIIHDLGEKFSLISGRHRLTYLRSKGIVSADCTVLSSEASIYTIFHHILLDQQTNGPLSLMETAYFIHHCLASMSEKDVITFFLHRLGLPQQPSLIKQYCQLLDLEPEIQLQIHQGLINMAIAQHLLALNVKDRRFLAILFNTLQAGTNKQRKILQFGLELSKRTNRSIEDLFTTDDFQKIFNHPEMNLPQKTHTLLTLLQKKTFPRSQESEVAFQQRVNKLQLPQNMSLTHSQNFEKNEVCLSITFPDMESCEKAWKEKAF